MLRNGKANARRFAANVRPIIDEIMRAGATSHNAIAAKLNERNVRTARGGKWTHVQVGAILHPFVASAVAPCMMTFTLGPTGLLPSVLMCRCATAASLGCTYGAAK